MTNRNKYPLPLLSLILLTLFILCIKVYYLYSYFYFPGREYIGEGVFKELFIPFVFLPSIQIVVLSIFLIGLICRKKWTYRLLIFFTIIYLFLPAYEFFKHGSFYLSAKTLSKYLMTYGLIAFLFLCIGSKKLKDSLSEEGGTLYFKVAIISFCSFFLVFFGTIFYLRAVDRFAAIKIIELENIHQKKLSLKYRLDKALGYSFPVPANSLKEEKLLRNNLFWCSFVEKPNELIFRLSVITDLQDDTRLLYPFVGVQTRSDYIRCLRSQDWSLFPLILRRFFYKSFGSYIYAFGDLNGFGITALISSKPDSSAAQVQLENHENLKIHEIMFGERAYVGVDEFVNLILHINKDVQPATSPDAKKLGTRSEIPKACAILSARW